MLRTVPHDRHTDFRLREILPEIKVFAQLNLDTAARVAAGSCCTLSDMIGKRGGFEHCPVEYMAAQLIYCSFIFLTFVKLF